MRDPKWTRLIGLCAVLALALQGAGAPGHAHESGCDGSCVFCDLLQGLLLQPGQAGFDLPAPAAAGYVAGEPAPVAASALPSLHPSRGPPA